MPSFLHWLDLSILYGAPGLSLAQTLPDSTLALSVDLGTANPESRVQRLREAMANCGEPLPLMNNGKRTPTGMELFDLVTKNPDYYPLQADKNIQDKNVGYFSKLISGSVLLELCAGDSHKVVRLLERTPKENWPRHIIINDIVGHNLKASFRNLRALGYPANKISTLRGNVLEDDLWVKIDARLATLHSGPVVGMMWGATPNDFKQYDLTRLLGRLHQLPSQSHFGFTIDNTTDKQTLHAAYDTCHLRQLALAGAEHFLRTNREFDVTKMSSFVSIRTDGVFTDVTLSIESLGTNFLCPYNPIRKIPIEQLESMFTSAGTEIVQRLPFSDPERFPRANYAFYDIQARPTLGL